MSRIAPWYALIFKDLDRIVQRRGWNVCLHGSMQRDLDLVLIPWVKDADHIDVVIDDIRKFVEGSYQLNLKKKANAKRGYETKQGLEHYAVEEKPHGRKAISIYIGASGLYLDISIMPRVEKPEA